MQNLVIIEGIWGTGKTTLAAKLKKQGYFVITEPHHINAKVDKTKKDLTWWYIKEHMKNMENAVRLVQEEENVVVERSVLSAIAFSETFLSMTLEDEFKKTQEYFKKILLSLDSNLLFVYLPPKNITQIIQYMQKDTAIKNFSDYSLLQSFDARLQELIEKLKESSPELQALTQPSLYQIIS